MWTDSNSGITYADRPDHLTGRREKVGRGVGERDSQAKVPLELCG